MMRTHCSNKASHNNPKVAVQILILCGRAGDAAEGKLRRSMTAHEVVGGDLFLYRGLLSADGLRILAPGMEMTTRRGIGRVGYFALEDDPVGAKARIRFGDRRQEGFRIWMLRRREQFFGRRGLHDTADVHYRDPVADVLDDAQVVSDEEIGKPKSFLKLEEEVQDLCLDRHVQGGDGFVRNDQMGIQGKGAGDADALTLTTREGMRVSPHVFRPEANEAEHLHDPVGSFLRVTYAVDEQRLAHDVQQGHSRVQGGERVLKDHLHLTPKGPKSALRNGRHIQDFTIVQQENLTGRRRNGPQDTAGSRGFSAAALSDEGQCLSPIHKKCHVVHRLHQADGLLEKTPSNGEIFLEPLYIEEHGFAWTGIAVRHSRPTLITGRESNLFFYPRRQTEEAGPPCRSDRQWRKRNGDGRGNPLAG